MFGCVLPQRAEGETTVSVLLAVLLRRRHLFELQAFQQKWASASAQDCGRCRTSIACVTSGMGSYIWVPEGSLAGFIWGAFLRSGRPRRPGKALKNVGGFAPHMFEGLPGPPGPARPQKRTPKKSGQTAFRYPAMGFDKVLMMF